MDGMGLDQTAGRANAMHATMTWQARLTRWFKALPERMRQNLPVTIMVGAWLGIFTWEVVNTTEGFRRAFPDRDWLQIAFVGFACPLGFMIAFRVMMESFRDGKTALGIGFTGVTLIAFILTGFFTFSNFVGETQVTGMAAREVNEDRQALRDTIRRMDRELTSMPEPLSLEADKELLASRIAEAAGWGMADLNPDGACKADLKNRQRFLCNDAAAIRDDIIRGEAMAEAKAAKLVEIAKKEDELASLQIAEAGAQYNAMAQMTGGKISAEFLSSWALLIASIGFLIIDAVFGDYLLERRERATGKGD